LLVAVVVLGIALAAVGEVWKTHAQREREAELLYIGRDFERAVASYYQAGNMRQFPQSVDDLLEDKRFPEPKHHLRRFYPDPMTGKQDWTILHGDMVGVTGLASSSSAEPLKKAGFATDEAAFADAQTYSDWKFEMVPRIGRRRGAIVPPAAD
jgi:type II secretory pathway pseudopilin PulG